MPQPTLSDVHVSRPLTNISVAYIQNASNFVADEIFPNIPVLKNADAYFKYDRSDFWRNQFRKRAPATESAGSGWKITTDSYYAEVWALHKDIDDQIRANTDSPLDMDRDATIWLTQQALIAREVYWAASYFTTGLWTGVTGSAADITGVTASPSTNEVFRWDDYTNSNPIADIKAYTDRQHLLTGMRPNTLVMGRQVWTQLSEHPDLIDRIKYSSSGDRPAIVTRQAVAALFEIDRILIADGIQATSVENPAFETSMTTAFIAGKKAFLTYVNPTPSIMQPSSGYTFSWTGYLGASRQGMRVKKFRMEPLASDRVEGEMAYAQKIVGSDMGTFFNNIIS